MNRREFLKRLGITSFGTAIGVAALPVVASVPKAATVEVISGGIVERDGFALIHRSESVLPRKVAEVYGDDSVMARFDIPPLHVESQAEFERMMAEALLSAME